MMAVGDLTFAFDADKGLTPDAVAKRRALAEALMGRASQAPSNIGEGLSAIGNALLYRKMIGDADKGEAAGRDASQSAWDSIFGGGSSGAPVSASISSGAPGASAPQTADAAKIREGLITRGLPEHVADGFLMNFQDESGFAPGINEQNPTVPGSRGGFGLYQLTGPRRVAYEQFAADRGVNPADVDAQLDFLMTELQGPEAKAAQSIFAAPDAGSAAAAIAKDFLRPAEQHLNERVARYTGGAASPVQVASLDGSIGLPQPAMGAGQGAAPMLPPLDVPQEVDTLPAPQRVAQAMTAPAGAGTPNMQQLMTLAADPWLSDGQKAVVNALLGQQLQQQQMASDPLRQLQLERERLELEQMQNPQADWQTIEGPGGDVYRYDAANPESRPELFFDVPDAAPEVPDSVAALDLRAQRAGLKPGTPEYNEFMLSGGGGGQTINVNTGASDEFYGALDKKLAEQTSALIDAGMNAQSNNIRLGELEGLLQTAPQGLQGAMVQAAGAIGIPTEGLDEIQAAQALINQMVPGQRPPGSGTMSDADLALFKQSLPAIMNQSGGNQRILQTMRAINDYTIAQAQIADRVANREITPEEGRRLQREVPNPLAGLRQTEEAPTPEIAPAQSQPPVISQQDYQALPSGSPFIAADDPTRTIRIKP